MLLKRIYILIFFLSVMGCSYTPPQDVPSQPDFSMKLIGYASGDISNIKGANILTDKNGCGFDSNGDPVTIRGLKLPDGGLMPAFRIMDYSFKLSRPARFYVIIIDSNEKHVSYINNDNFGCDVEALGNKCVHLMLLNLPADKFNMIRGGSAVDKDTIKDPSLGCLVPSRGQYKSCELGPSFSFLEKTGKYSSGLGYQYDGPCPDGKNYQRYTGTIAYKDSFNFTHGSLLKWQKGVISTLTSADDLLTEFFGDFSCLLDVTDKCVMYTAEVFALSGNVGSDDNLLRNGNGAPLDRAQFRERNKGRIVNNPDGTPTHAVFNFLYIKDRKMATDRTGKRVWCYNAKDANPNDPKVCQNQNPAP